VKVVEGGIPSKNQIMDGKATEGSESSEKVREAKKELDWIEEWIMGEDRWY
jgi:hypothetical protein